MAAGDPGPPALRLDAIRKSFGPTRALDGARLTLLPGEVHALLGENGAGKTTLVSIAAGLLAPDEGTIEVSGRGVSFRSPRQAREAGIALVPQHDLLVEAATVAENLARLDPGAPFLESRPARRRRVEELSARFGLSLGPPDALAGDLPVGTRQRIEIAGALIPDPAVLVLDEPTALLSPDESAALFAALRARAASGHAVVLITHRLGEVFAVADRLTVLSRGRTVKESPVAGTRSEEVAELLLASAGVDAAERRFAEASIGVEEEPLPSGTAAVAGGALLSVSGLVPEGSQAPPLSLDLHARETLVLLSIDGNGADRIAASIAGTWPARGEVRVGGKALRPEDPRAFRLAGGAFVPADRRAEGVVGSLPLAENLALGDPGLPFLLRRADLAKKAEGGIRRFGIRAGGPSSRARDLSGGNQQKLVLARELGRPPRVLVAVHPTRGLDIASTAEVLLRIAGAAAEGAAVLVVTSDPDEARALGAPIRVVYRGELSAPFPPDTPVALLGRWMAGVAA